MTDGACGTVKQGWTKPERTSSTLFDRRLCPSVVTDDYTLRTGA